MNGLRFHYVDWGKVNHQPLLLLHGFTGHARVWDDSALIMREKYHVLALNQRGHGDSQWSENACYSLDDHFADITRFIDILNLSDLVLVGHSMGGRNALFYTACHSEKVSRLILVDSRPGNSDKAANALKRHINELPSQVKSYQDIIPAAQKLYPYLSAEMCLHMAKYGFKKQSNGTYVSKCDMRMGLKAERFECSTEELWPFMKNISCPTLIVRGEKSAFLSLEETKKMCEVLPNAIWKEIPDASHMPAQENPDVFNKVVLDFLMAL